MVASWGTVRTTWFLGNASHLSLLRVVVLGKAEGSGNEWHGHVTAITVAPEYRRLFLARKMMALLELVSDHSYKGFFVDLYVRCNNAVAMTMYEGLGYSVYRRVREYYGTLGVGKGGRDEEDAFGTSHPRSTPHYIIGLLYTFYRYAKTFIARSRATLSTCKWP